MDPVTHGLTGALVGKAFFSARYGRTGTLAVTLGALFPDSDVVFELFAPNELATLEWHRGVTHSFVGLPVFALLLAGLTRYLRRGQAQPTFLSLCGLYGLGLAIHILLDLITSFGTMVWSPLAMDRPAWDLVFILDLTFTGIVLLPQVAAWIYAARRGALRRGLLAWVLFAVSALALGRLVRPLFGDRLDVVLTVSGLLGAILLLPALAGWGFAQRRAVFCRIGVAALAGYFALCTVCHELAKQRVDTFAVRENLTVLDAGALPAPPWVFHWSGLIRTPAGVHQAEINLLEAGRPPFAFFAHAAPNRYIEIAEGLVAVQKFRWFARFPLVSYRTYGNGVATLHIVEYADLRFSLGARRRRNPPAFAFRVVLTAAGDVVTAGFVGD
jgi:membrane-bound metal-dependent hydrolase YbcI (DUF457 family)